MRKFLTPNIADLSSAYVRRSLCLPGELLRYLDGSSQLLASRDNWESFGSASPDQMAEIFTSILSSWTDCIMIGSILPYATQVLPDGVLLCDGSSYTEEQYPELFAVISDSLKIPTLPILPGEFYVPDLRSHFIMGASGSVQVGDTGGEAEHVLTVGEMPAHDHGYTPPVANIDIEAPGVPDVIAAGVGFPAETGSSGGGNAHNNLPPYVKLIYGIVAK